jgi:hypothetical protein
MFSVSRDGQYELRQLAFESKETKPFGNVRSVEPIEAAFSPDGRWVAYATNPGGNTLASVNFGVFIQPFPATGERYQVPKVRRDYHPMGSRRSAALLRPERQFRSDGERPDRDESSGVVRAARLVPRARYRRPDFQ